MRLITAKHVATAFDDLDGYGTVQAEHGPELADLVQDALARAEGADAAQSLYETVGLSREAQRELHNRITTHCPECADPYSQASAASVIGMFIGLLIGLRTTPRALGPPA